jgi:glycine cleavage system aminomethyltransferase T
VRSACWSPTLERLIAMVVIDAPLIGPGARFDVELEPGGTAVGVVGDHPIYDTHKLRPRA